jgi:hypothetical protein
MATISGLPFSSRIAGDGFPYCSAIGYNGILWIAAGNIYLLYSTDGINWTVWTTTPLGYKNNTNVNTTPITFNDISFMIPNAIYWLFNSTWIIIGGAYILKCQHHDPRKAGPFNNGTYAWFAMFAGYGSVTQMVGNVNNDQIANSMNTILTKGLLNGQKFPDCVCQPYTPAVPSDWPSTSYLGYSFGPGGPATIPQALDLLAAYFRTYGGAGWQL